MQGAHAVTHTHVLMCTHTRMYMTHTRECMQTCTCMHVHSHVHPTCCPSPHYLTHSHALICCPSCVCFLMRHTLLHVEAHERGVLMVSHVCYVHAGVRVLRGAIIGTPPQGT